MGCVSSKKDKHVEPTVWRSTLKENNEVPKGNNEVPKGNNEVPKGNNEEAKVNNKTPKANNEPPKGNIEAPKGKNDAPKGNIESPKGNNEAPKGNIEPAKGIKDINEFSKFIVGGYEVLGHVIHVPYATIYNSRQVSAYLPRALKIIDLSQPEGISISSKHLETELKQLKSLDHINILRIHDMFPYNNKFCVAMEPLSGTIMLLDFIQSLTHLKESFVCKIVMQILSAVEYCHGKKVIHRDLNPKLIFVTNTENLHVKISEFGSSAFIDPENNLVGKSFPRIYTAPEVFDNYYNEKCDLWSVGIILHLLLTGKLPIIPSQNFTSVNLSSLSGRVSEGALDLLNKLLDTNFRTRISAAEALNHPWIKNGQNQNLADIDEALRMLKSFTKFSEAQDAVREFVASQIISYNDSQYFIENFQKLDSNNDGKITKEELIEHYIKTMSKNEATVIVDKIFEVADRNKNGSIEFAEFIRGSMKNSSLLSISNVEKAFKLLDKDNNQNLSIEELQYLLGDTADKAIRQLIQEADQNKDGQISFEEFLRLLKKKYDS